MTQALSISTARPDAWKNDTINSELTFDHLYDLAEWMVVRADRDPKWQDAYDVVRNTIRRIDWSINPYPWVLATKYLLNMGIGLTVADMQALGLKSSSYVASMRDYGVEIVGVRMAHNGKRGRPRLRYYRADLLPPEGEHV